MTFNMDFSLGDIVAVVVALAALAVAWGKTQANAGNQSERLKELEESAATAAGVDVAKFEAVTRQAASLEVRLAVVEALTAQSREERMRYHQETQAALAEIRKDVSKMIVNLAQISSRAVKDFNDLKDQNL